eukprot:268499_1
MKLYRLILNSVLLRIVLAVNMAKDGEAWQCNIDPTHSVPPLSQSDLGRIEQLQQIQLFFRHGLRLGDAPLTSFFPNSTQSEYTCNISTITSRTTTNYYQEFIPLQMKKTYVQNEQSFPNSNCEWTQSTYNGFIQMQNHAQMISAAYIGSESYQLHIPTDTNLSLSHYFSLHSTDYDRTIGSTYTLIVSLLNHLGLNASNWNDWDIPLHTHDRTSDPFLPHTNQRCTSRPQFMNWMQIYANDPNIQNAKYEQEYMQSEFVVNAFNNYINEGGVIPELATSLWKTVTAMQYPYCNGQDIPLTNTTFFMLNNFSYSFPGKSVDVSTEYARDQRYCYEHTFAIPILNEYKRAMDRRMQNDTDRIVIHMAHLDAFVSLMKGLDLPTALEMPAMGEMLSFELYTAAGNNDSYLFRWVRKGETLHYRYCDYSNGTELCDLRVLLENDFVDVVHMSVWESEVCGHILDHNRCGYSQVDVDNGTHSDDKGVEDTVEWGTKTFHVGVGIGIGIGVVCMLIILGCVRCCVNKKNDSLIKAENNLRQYESNKKHYQNFGEAQKYFV